MPSNAAVVNFAFWVGFTISIDVFFYTSAKAASEKLNFKNWTGPVAFAHVILMGTIIGAIYLLGKGFDSLRPPLGIFGFGIVVLYLYELMSKWRGEKPYWSLTDAVEKAIGGRWFLLWLSPRVLAVSLDCIPVAAVVAIQTNDWSTYQLALGLGVIGLTVALVTQASLVAAWLFKQLGRNTSTRTKALSCLGGNWIVLSLLASFGLLALCKGVGRNFPPVQGIEMYHLLPFTLIWASMFFCRNWQVLLAEQKKEVLGDDF